MIDRQTIEHITAAANIVEVVGDFVSLKRAGASYKACCPFHSERTPSFVVTPSRGIFKCFGCGKGGDAARFVMEHEKMSYVEALRYLARKYGIPVEEHIETAQEKQQNNDIESMMVLNSWATEYFQNQLTATDEGQSIGLQYFRERGFTDATIKKFALGYCPRKGDSMSAEAISEGYREQYLVDTGLTVKRDSGGYYDRFHGRVMFPIQSLSGRTIGFGGRILEKNDRTAKYLNSPESVIYNKSKTLYGISHAKGAIVKENFCILVEGYTDVIQMHQTGIDNVVASSGTSLTTDQIRLIRRFTHNITVIYDGDPAGIKASMRGIDMILEEGMQVRCVLLPKGEDPDSFARTRSSDQVREYIVTQEEDFIGFKARLLLAEAGNDPIRRTELTRSMVDSIAIIPDPISRSMFIRQTAALMDVDIAVLTAEVARRRTTAQYDRETADFVHSIRRQHGELAPTKKVRAGSSLDILEREIVGLLMEYGDRSFELKEGDKMVAFNFAETLFSEFDNDNITLRNEQCRTIYTLYRTHYEAMGRGVRIEASLFINDPTVGDEVVAILTSNENYTVSALFEEHDTRIRKVDERLGEIIPRQMMLYKSKTIEAIITEMNEQLSSADLTDEASDAILAKIVALNTIRRYTSLRLGRVIL